jgi:uncharacterized protein (TIGR00369 family)
MDTINQFAQIISDIPFNRTLGLTLATVEKDHITMRFTHRDELIGNFLHGILHGGVISSALDMAGGAATMIAIAQKHSSHSLEQLANQISKTSTINIHIDYLRPGKGTEFIATAWVLRSGSKISVTRMELMNEESVLIATGTGTYLIG